MFFEWHDSALSRRPRGTDPDDRYRWERARRLSALSTAIPSAAVATQQPTVASTRTSAATSAAEVLSNECAL